MWTPSSNVATTVMGVVLSNSAYVVDAVFLGAVAAHVVNDAGGGDDDAVARLLDALHLADGGMRRVERAAHLHTHDLPGAAHVGRTVHDGLGAPGEERRWEFGPAAGGVNATGMSSAVVMSPPLVRRVRSPLYDDGRRRPVADRGHVELW